MVPIAHATDLGGSIRIPSACCATFGFKPTAGLNSVGPYFVDVAHGLNSDHVITRTVRDSAAAMDMTALTMPGQPRYLDDLNKEPGKLRVLATVHAADGTQAGPRQVQAVEHTVAILRDLGHEVTLVDTSPLVPVGEWFDLLWVDDIPPLLAARALECGHQPRLGDLEPLTEMWLEEWRRAGPQALADAIRSRDATARQHLSLFDRCDVILTPSLATDPAPIGTMGFRDHPTPHSWAEAGYGFAPFFILANVTGQPAASLPLPMLGGLPVGVHLMARPNRDLMVLQLSRQLEQAFDWATAYRTHWQEMASRMPLPKD
jgi:amidase